MELTLEEVKKICEKWLGEDVKIEEDDYCFNIEYENLKFWISKEFPTWWWTFGAINNIYNDIKELMKEKENGITTNSPESEDNPNNNPELRG